MNIKKNRVLWPIIALIVCATIIQMERFGIKYEHGKVVSIVKSQKEEVSKEPSCMLFVNPLEDTYEKYKEMTTRVLSDMRIPYQIVDVQNEKKVNTLSQYMTVVMTQSDWSSIAGQTEEIREWIVQGGRMLVVIPPKPDEQFQNITEMLGISKANGYSEIRSFSMEQNIMIGLQKGESIPYVDAEEDPLEVALNVEIDDTCKQYMTADNGTPLLWEKKYGKGKVVVLNENITEKYQRGFVATAYSLLEDNLIYPVINASAFYLDDFPAPVPSGDSTYITEEYGIDIGTFYTTIWWPTMIALEEKYGIKHTGMIIEDYNDIVQKPFVRQNSLKQFESFGNMLLQHDGELGFHGYNHQPLCLQEIDENRQFGSYKLWKSKEDIKEAMSELNSFSQKVFPKELFQVYVPPSNIMSEEGKKALLEACPGIKVLASTYMTDGVGVVYEQEFEVEDNGIVDTPRIVSGCDIDEYQKLTAISELNFHYVQSHFIHPDDVLDVDRGASLGWSTMEENFEKYLDFIYTSAPNIRNTTGSEIANDVIAFDTGKYEVKQEENILTIKIDSPTGDMCFFMRLNEGKYQSFEGGEIELVAEGLYMIHVTGEEMKITLE